VATPGHRAPQRWPGRVITAGHEMLRATVGVKLGAVRRPASGGIGVASDASPGEVVHRQFAREQVIDPALGRAGGCADRDRLRGASDPPQSSDSPGRPSRFKSVIRVGRAARPAAAVRRRGRGPRRTGKVARSVTASWPRQPRESGPRAEPGATGLRISTRAADCCADSGCGPAPGMWIFVP